MIRNWGSNDFKSLPKGWTIQPIGNIFKFSSGKSRPKNTTKQKTEDFKIPVYGGNGVLGYTNEAFIKETVLILGRVGEYCGCVHLTENESWISDNALYAKEKLTNDDLVFLKYCFEFLNLNQYSNKMGQPLITQGVINEVKFALPPLPEQRKIAYVLNTIQKAIEQQDNLIRTTTELKKNLMQKLFTEGTNGEKQKETEIGLVPQTWEVLKLGNLVEIKGGKRLPKGKKLLDKEGYTPYIRVTDFEANSVNTENLKYLSEDVYEEIKRYIINKDDIYISIAGSIGFVGMIPEELNGANLTENAARLIIIDKEISVPRYLMYFLASPAGQKQSLSFALKNAQPKLSLASIKSITVALPNPTIQKEIINIFDLIRAKQKYHEKKKNALSALFKTLLYELMTGQRRVNELDFKAKVKGFKQIEMSLVVAAES